MDDIIDAVVKKITYDNTDSTGTIKIILLDVDGVLLDWNAGFDQWMDHQGFEKRLGKENAYLIDERFRNVDHALAKYLIRAYNESEAVLGLKPMPGAVEAISTLYAQNYRFLPISSHSSENKAHNNRLQVLNQTFRGVFPQMRSLPTGAYKDLELDNFRGTNYWWIEDKTENALAGLERGLRCILMHHDHNKDDHHEGLHRAHTWQDIVDIITSTGSTHH